MTERIRFLREQTLTSKNKIARRPIPFHSTANEKGGIPVRKALALKWMFDTMPVYIGEKELINGIYVVYTKESQTADAYIEKTAKELEKNYKVTVATSDGLEQLIIFGSGASRMPARHLEADVIQAEKHVKEVVKKYNLEANASGFNKILEEKLSEIPDFTDEEND